MCLPSVLCFWRTLTNSLGSPLATHPHLQFEERLETGGGKGLGSSVRWPSRPKGSILPPGMEATVPVGSQTLLWEPGDTISALPRAKRRMPGGPQQTVAPSLKHGYRGYRAAEFWAAAAPGGGTGAFQRYELGPGSD